MRFATVIHCGKPKTVIERQGLFVDLEAIAQSSLPVGRSFVEAIFSGKLKNVISQAHNDDLALLPTILPQSVRFLAPIPDPFQVFAIGLNYLSHCREQGREAPSHPIFFHKAVSSLIGHKEAVVSWPITSQLDYEGELAIVIGEGGRGIRAENAHEHIFGFTIMNDITARDLQRADRQWSRSKGLDTFGPMGPIIVTPDEMRLPCRLRTWVNGELRQDASSDEMVFSIEHLIAHISEAITLRPGDIISTGTPGGVGVFASPPRYLIPGDEIRVSIEGIGELVNVVVNPM